MLEILVLLIPRVRCDEDSGHFTRNADADYAEKGGVFKVSFGRGAAEHDFKSRSHRDRAERDLEFPRGGTVAQGYDVDLVVVY